MARMYYDATKQETRMDLIGGGCLVGFISWGRLIEQLKAAGEFREGETVLALEIRDDGIMIKYELKNAR